MAFAFQEPGLIDLKQGTNIRVPFPPSYSAGNSGFEHSMNGQPVPPSLRHLPSLSPNSKSPPPGTNLPPMPPLHLHSDSPRSGAESPEQLRVRSPQSLHKMAFDIATLRKPHQEYSGEDNTNLDMNENNDTGDEALKEDNIEEKLPASGAAVTA